MYQAAFSYHVCKKELMQTRHDSETLIGSTGLIMGEGRPVSARWLKKDVNKSS